MNDTANQCAPASRRYASLPGAAQLIGRALHAPPCSLAAVAEFGRWRADCDKMKTIRTFLQWPLLAALITGCVSVARVSDFSRTADGLDFGELARRDYDSKDAIWNQKTGYEYFIEAGKIDDDELVKGITSAVELDWWDNRGEAGLDLTFVPAQHWTRRTPFDHRVLNQR